MLLYLVNSMATTNRKIGSRASAKFFGMWEGFVRFQRHIFGCRAWHLCGAAGGWRKACGSAAPGKWEGEIRFFDFPTPVCILAWQ